jgi:rhodanese-related sulfurtransferase
LTLAPLTVARVRRLVDDGATVVDVRPIDDYAAAHVPGSLSIELRAAFGTWLGWLLPEDAVVVVVRNLDQDPAEILGQAAKVGYDIVGELDGGVPAWVGADLRTTATALVTPTAMTDEVGRVVDVRQAAEFAAGHVPGAVHSELGGLAAAAASLADGPMTVMCGHGERAMSAASVLERAGRDDVSVLLGGPSDWATSRGVDLEPGP